MERDSRGKLLAPRIESNVPDFLLSQCSPAEKWMMEHQSVTMQQNEWLIMVSLDHDIRLRDTESKQATIETLRLVLTSKWALLVWIGGSIVTALVAISAVWTAWKTK